MNFQSILKCFSLCSVVVIAACGGGSGGGIGANNIVGSSNTNMNNSVAAINALIAANPNNSVTPCTNLYLCMSPLSAPPVNLQGIYAGTATRFNGASGITENMYIVTYLDPNYNNEPSIMGFYVNSIYGELGGFQETDVYNGNYFPKILTAFTGLTTNIINGVYNSINNYDPTIPDTSGSFTATSFVNGSFINGNYQSNIYPSPNFVNLTNAVLNYDPISSTNVIPLNNNTYTFYNGSKTINNGSVNLSFDKTGNWILSDNGIVCGNISAITSLATNFYSFVVSNNNCTTLLNITRDFNVYLLLVNNGNNGFLNVNEDKVYSF